MVNDFILDKALGNIKEKIRIEKFDDIKFLIDTNDKLPYDITLRKVIILINDMRY